MKKKTRGVWVIGLWAEHNSIGPKKEIEKKLGPLVSNGLVSAGIAIMGYAFEQ